MNAELDEPARDLTRRAVRTLEAGFSPRHRAAAAIRTADGATYTGLHLDTTISSVAVHAEEVAVGHAITDRSERDGSPDGAAGPNAPDSGESGDPVLIGVAAVSKREADEEPAVIPPCGACRELLADYATDAWVVVPGDDGPRTRPLAELLPSDVMDVLDSPRFD